ncbi:hypothetical protein EDC54_105192 [Samsonia erythrinae]|uniref:Uncharacterized protein n=1 Tax=Samsonia erythrinae TaxID=160434 RepID=A0A4R3VJD6_9GAMM|nr:hypothetical protein EDC54_105192 [Samsonia erythrinae]
MRKQCERGKYRWLQQVDDEVRSQSSHMISGISIGDAVEDDVIDSGTLFS